MLDGWWGTCSLSCAVSCEGRLPCSLCLVNDCVAELACLYTPSWFFFVSSVSESGKNYLRVIMNEKDSLAVDLNENVVHQNGVHSYLLKIHLHFSSIFFFPAELFLRDATFGHLINTRFSSQALYLTWASCASSKQVQSLSYPLVYKSNIVSPRGQPEYWSSLQGCQNSAQFNIVLKQIVPLGARQRTRQYLAHPAGRAFPAAGFTGFITPLCTIVRTLSSCAGSILQSSLSEWHFYKKR